jgi:hypothetical protein
MHFKNKGAFMKLKKNAVAALSAAFSLLLLFTAAASAYEISYYKDSKVGVFKVIIDGKELKKHPVKSIVPVFDETAVSEVYSIDSRSDRRDEVNIDPEDKQARDKLQERINAIEKEKSKIYSSRSELSEENNFFEKYIERSDKGQIKASSAEIVRHKNKIEENKVKIKDLDEKLEPLSKESNKLYSELYSRRTHNIPQKDLNKDVKFYVYGRFFKSGPSAVSLVNAESSETILTINLNLIDREDSSDKDILKKWLEVQRNRFINLRSGIAGGVFSYIAGQSARRFTQSTSENEATRSNLRGISGGNPDLYSVSSGALAIQEALQLDRMTGKLDKDSNGAYIEIETLKAPAIKSHPFDLMLKGRKPDTYPLDALVPADFYYLHFSNIRDQIELSDLMDKWGTNFLQMMQVSSTNSMMKEKYLGQLCLQVSELTRLFGDKVIDDMAICGADPFLEDGTDLSVIFSIKNKTVFNMNVSRYFAEAKSTFKDIKDETIDASGFKVRALYTPDGKVSSYSCYINDFMVYSNSRAAILQIIDTVENPRKSMAKADDFLYMRTVYESGATSENAFLYLSDAHIRKLVGPEWKIGRQRRLNCAASLRTINNAVTLYKMDKKTDRPSVETLIAGGYLEANYLFCPDGGSYSLDPETMEPRCTKHRRLRYITPVSEITPRAVTKDEADQYKRFVDEYNNYWTKFFDPVGIRIKIDPKNISLETCILPLVENSFYNRLSALAGGAAVNFRAHNVPGRIMSLRWKINLKNHENIRAFEEMLSSTSFTIDRFYKFMGDNISVNLIDSDIRFTLDPMFARMLSWAGRDSFIIFGSFLLSALNHPIFVSVGVTDMKEAETFLIELLKFLEEENRRMSRGFFQTDFSVYKVWPSENGPAIYSINYRFFMIGLNFHVMIHDGQLIIATKRSILTDILKTPAADAETHESNFELELVPANFVEISKTYNITWGEKMRAACHANLWPIYVLNRLRGVELANLNRESLITDGYFPYCPSGGEYRFDKERGLISCSLHGDAYCPKQPMELDDKNELIKFFKGLKKLAVALSFTEHGIMTKVLLER